MNLSELDKYQVGGLLLTGYVASSLLFFKKPHLLWSRKVINNPILKQLQNQPNKKVLLISHRGGPLEKQENTIDAFQHSIDLGANMIETDVVMTKDEQIVVFHDTDLIRLCGQNKKISDVNYHDLKIQDNFDIDFSIDQKFQSPNGKLIHPPLLDEVFQKFPQTLINLEIKTPSEKACQKVSQLLYKHKRTESTVWGVKRREQSDMLEQLAPDTFQFCSYDELAKMLLYYYSGMLPFMKPQGNFIEIPLYSEEYRKYETQKFYRRYHNKQLLKNPDYDVNSPISGYQQWIINLQLKLYFGFMKLMEKNIVNISDHLRKRNYFVFAWVLNDEKMYQRAIDLNMDGIMTDKPSDLKQFLLKKELYFKYQAESINISVLQQNKPKSIPETNQQSKIENNNKENPELQSSAQQIDESQQSLFQKIGSFSNKWRSQSKNNEMLNNNQQQSQNHQIDQSDSNLKK